MGIIPWLEVRRKLMHLIPLAIPIGYQYVSKEKALLVLLPIFAFYFFSDVFRHWHKGYRELFDRVMTSRFLREREKKGLIGSSYFVIGALLTILFFPKQIAITSLYILVISDASAGMVGSSWGKIYLFREKTLEGSVAFFVTGMIVVAFTMKGNLFWGAAAVLGATLAELFSYKFKLDDNLAIPLVAAGIMLIGF